MKEVRLPHNNKENLLYGGVICLITVIIMLILNICSVFGKFDLDILACVLKLTPIIWLVAMLIEMFIVGKIAEKLVDKFSSDKDGFNAKILFNILFCVTGMSAVMTIVGSFIGNGQISWEPFITFPSHWPRNFFVAFWCEILLAQPIARMLMKHIHKKQA